MLGRIDHRHRNDINLRSSKFTENLSKNTGLINHENRKLSYNIHIAEFSNRNSICAKRLNGALPILEKLKNLIEVRYLENPMQLRIDPANHNFPVILLQPTPNIQTKTQNLRRKESNLSKIEDQLLRLILLDKIPDLSARRGYPLNIADTARLESRNSNLAVLGYFNSFARQDIR